MPVKDMTGLRFNRLVVVSRAASDRNGNARWHCVCDCGNATTSSGFTLRNGEAKSCGCLTTDQLKARITKHNQSTSAECKTWYWMRNRCNRSWKKSHLYKDKGISVCERWNSFEAFLSDMGRKPSPQHTLERIDGTKGYSPDNCRWATKKEQARNTTQNRLVLYRGRHVPLAQAIEEAGNFVCFATAKGRLKAGWPVADAVERPPTRYPR